MIPSHPHQWSSQLSTVISESEGGSSRGHSRSVSLSSSANGAGHGRRGSAGWSSSRHSRQVQSISSSLAAQLEDAAASVVVGGAAGTAAGDSDSIISSTLERPYPAYTRPGPWGGPSGIRMVRDQDEHGDGLADLHDVSQKPSRSGLSGFFSSDTSGRNLHSSASISSRTSSLSSAIPAWAR